MSNRKRAVREVFLYKYNVVIRQLVQIFPYCTEALI